MSAMDKITMAAMLRYAARLIEAGDSIEGSIGWVASRDGGFYPFGVFRYGNQDGQGFVHVIGNEDEARKRADDEWSEQ